MITNRYVSFFDEYNIEIVSGKDFSVVKLHLELTQEFRFGQIRIALT